MLQPTPLLLFIVACGAPALVDGFNTLGPLGLARARNAKALSPTRRFSPTRAAHARTHMQHDGEISERDTDGLSDLSLLGAFGKLRAGVPTKTRELAKTSRINESFEIQCEKASYLLKINRQCSASQMFEGEAASQQALRFAGMMCPKTLRLGDLPHGGSYMIQEFHNFDQDVLQQPETQRALGIMLARMHSHHPERHTQFGFGLDTCLGTRPMDNSFSDSWTDFFINQRLRPHFDLVVEQFPEEGRELVLLAPLIFDKARSVLDQDSVKPSILHGNLSPRRTGAVTQERNGLATTHVYLTGPCSFYGDSEFDMAFEDWPIPESRPDFSPYFYKGYYSTLPRRPGHQRRRQVYQLFHLLNGALMNGGPYIHHAVQAAYRFLTL